MLIVCTALIVCSYMCVFYFFLSQNGSTVVTRDMNQGLLRGDSHGIKDSSTRNEPVALENTNPAGVTVGFAVTVTGCGTDPITEGAAVLKHAIHLASVKGNRGGRYDYKMYAIYHPDGASCAEPLKDLGYELVRRETPVAVKDIQGEFLRTHIESNGCCGEKELVKLEAYSLVEHPIVVHLDLDTLVIKPMDALFDWMLSESGSSHDTSDVPIMWNDLPKPSRVNAFFTRDCKCREMLLYFPCF